MRAPWMAFLPNLQAANAWGSHQEEAQSESARKYQRFLEEELGQLLQSQAPKGSSQMSRRHPHRRSQPFDRQPCRQPMPSQPDQGSSESIEGQLVCASGQEGPADGQAKSSAGKYARHSGPRDQEHGVLKQQQQHGGHKGRYFSQVLPSSPGYAVNADSPQETQAVCGQRIRQLRSLNPDRQYKAARGSATAKQDRHAWQAEAGVERVELVSKGVESLPGYGLSLKQHPQESGRDAADSDLKVWRHAASHMRGISPQRRQLLLQSKFALFDSDSSSSDEDSWSVQKVFTSSFIASMCT